MVIGPKPLYQTLSPDSWQANTKCCNKHFVSSSSSSCCCRTAWNHRSMKSREWAATYHVSALDADMLHTAAILRATDNLQPNHKRDVNTLLHAVCSDCRTLSARHIINWMSTFHWISSTPPLDPANRIPSWRLHCFSVTSSSRLQTKLSGFPSITVFPSWSNAFIYIDLWTQRTQSKNRHYFCPCVLAVASLASAMFVAFVAYLLAYVSWVACVRKCTQRPCVALGGGN